MKNWLVTIRDTRKDGKGMNPTTRRLVFRNYREEELAEEISKVAGFYFDYDALPYVEFAYGEAD